MMYFTNSAGNLVGVDLVFNVGVRRALSAKIGDKAVGELLLDMSSNTAIDCFYECCKKSLDENGISKTEFEEQIDGEKLEQLEEAFIKAVENFTKPAERAEKIEMIKAAQEKMKSARKLLMQKAMGELDTILADLTK